MHRPYFWLINKPKLEEKSITEKVDPEKDKVKEVAIKMQIKLVNIIIIASACLPYWREERDTRPGQRDPLPAKRKRKSLLITRFAGFASTFRSNRS